MKTKKAVKKVVEEAPKKTTARKVPTLDVVDSGNEETCKECGHPDSKHYGSEKKWCNESGCQCQALTK